MTCSLVKQRPNAPLDFPVYKPSSTHPQQAILRSLEAGPIRSHHDTGKLHHAKQNHPGAQGLTNPTDYASRIATGLPIKE